MAEKPAKDNPAQREETEEELARQLIEAVAAAYFGACRRLAKMLNRRGQPR